jgi:hypothetical protein
MNKLLIPLVARFSTNIQITGSIYELKNAQKYVEDQVRKYDWAGYAASKYIPK